MAKRKLHPYKALSQRLFDGLQILRYDYTNLQVHEYILGKKEDVTFTYETFNKHKNACRKSSYLKEVRPKIFHTCFDVIDEMLAKPPYEYFWSSGSGTELGKYLKKDEIKGKREEEKLKGLIGVWKGLSWNKEETEKHPQKLDHYNVFCAEVKGNRKIRVHTKFTLFNEGNIYPVGTDRISVEIGTENRRAYLTGYIGFGDDLAPVKVLHMTYSDTGDDEVKCGLSAFIRLTDTSFDTFETGCVTLDKLTEDEKRLALFLTGKQHPGNYPEKNNHRH